MEAKHRDTARHKATHEVTERHFIGDGQAHEVIAPRVPVGRLSGLGEHVAHKRMAELRRSEPRREIVTGDHVELRGVGGNRTHISDFIRVRILAVRTRRRGAWGWDRTTYLRGSTMCIPLLFQ